VASRHLDLLFQPHYNHLLEFFFLFTLKVLDGKDLPPLAKAASSEFWVSLPSPGYSF
jgi:hypothetical protein